MGWTKEEVAVCITHLRKQFRDKSVHAYVPMRCVYARKPEVGEVPAASS